jgi:chromate transport protein ChrA
MENNQNPQEETNKPSLLQLVKFFLKIGATSFGGQVPTHICDSFLRNKWLNEQECLEALNLCQTLPGATSVNLATFVGRCFHGLAGSLISSIVLLLPGATLLIISSNILQSLPNQNIIQGALSTTAAATIGLIIGTAIRLASSIKQKQISLIITSLSFVLIGIYQLPVPLVIVGSGLIIFTWNKFNASIN